MNVESDIFDLLRAMPVFADTDDSVLRELEGISNVVTIPKGALMFSEGDVHADIYLVVTGTIVLDMITAQCGKQQILTLGEGDLLAWSSFLGDARMTSSAVVTEAARLIVIPSEKLRAVCDADHDVGYAVAIAVAKLISRRLIATRLQLLDLFVS